MEIEGEFEHINNESPALEVGSGLEQLGQEAAQDGIEPDALGGEQSDPNAPPPLPPVDPVAAANVHEILGAVLGAFMPGLLAGVIANDRAARDAGLSAKPGLVRMAEAWARVPFVQKWFGSSGGSPVGSALMESGVILGAGYVTIVKVVAEQQAKTKKENAPQN